MALLKLWGKDQQALAVFQIAYLMRKYGECRINSREIRRLLDIFHG